MTGTVPTGLFLWRLGDLTTRVILRYNRTETSCTNGYDYFEAGRMLTPDLCFSHRRDKTKRKPASA